MKKKNLFQRLLIIIVVLCPLLISCEKDPHPTFSILNEDALMNGLHFPAEGGEQTISFTVTDQDWWESRLTSPDGDNWCSHYYSYDFSQSREIKAIISATPNTTYDERNATYVLWVGDTEKTFNIRQEQNDAIIPGTYLYNAGYEGGIFNIPVSANIDYQIEIASEHREWLRVFNGETRSLFAHEITFEISPNESYSSRVATVYLRGKNVTKVIHIRQAERPTVIVSKENKKLTAYIATAGRLPNLIEDLDKTGITEVVLSGKMNGTDLKALRTLTNLQILDLYNIDIVAGGESYTSPQDPKVYFIKNDEIPDNMFYNAKIISIILPKSAKAIGEYAFKNCTSLINIYIPESVTDIAYCAFYGCISLQSIVIPNSVTNIDTHILGECSSLKTVTLSNALSVLPSRTFYKCKNLSRITLPASIKKLEDSFFGCTALNEVHVQSTDVPQINSYSFCAERYTPINFTLYVPKGCKEEYEASLWGKYATQIIEE